MPFPPPKWPLNTPAAISLTLDNMGEACDIDRNLWPPTSPVGRHFSVTQILPHLLPLLQKHDIKVTYFIETWNLAVYPDAIRELERRGHEVAWHAFRHENWASLEEEGEERGNFERSFGGEGLGRGVLGEGYKGFRPPGGRIHGGRTLGLCREFGLEYISPAAEVAAMDRRSGVVVLPFRWWGVDAMYYMESFGKLRVLKGGREEVLGSGNLVERYTRMIDQTIDEGGFLSLLFHPFLTNLPERLEAMERVVEYLAAKRNEGKIWLARCRDVAGYIKQNPDIVGDDPEWDNTSWR